MFPTAVNSQITDSITQVNTKVVGESPAMALSNLYVATDQAMGNAAHNATTSQFNSSLVAQATTVQGISTLYAIDTASAARGTAMIFA